MAVEAEAAGLIQQPDPFHVMARLDHLSGAAGGDGPVGGEELAQHQVFAVEETGGEQVQHAARRRFKGGIGRRRLPGQQGLQHVHVRVLATRQDGGQGLLPAAVDRVGHSRLDGGERREGQGQGALVLQHAVGGGQGEQDEGQVVEVGRSVDDSARVVGRVHPQGVVTAVVADQGVQAAPGDRFAVGPAERCGFGEDIDLTRLHPRAARAAGDRAAVEVQLLEEAAVGVDPGRRPQRQGLAEQPVADPVLCVRKRHGPSGLGRLAGFAKSALRCNRQREVTLAGLSRGPGLW